MSKFSNLCDNHASPSNTIKWTTQVGQSKNLLKAPLNTTIDSSIVHIALTVGACLPSDCNTTDVTLLVKQGLNASGVPQLQKLNISTFVDQPVTVCSNDCGCHFC